MEMDGDRYQSINLFASRYSFAMNCYTRRVSAQKWNDWLIALVCGCRPWSRQVAELGFYASVECTIEVSPALISGWWLELVRRIGGSSNPK